MEKYIGKFVKVNNKLGMIDALHVMTYSTQLGFVHSENNSWTGELVNIDDVKILNSDEEIKAAKKSALGYFENEANSVRDRMSMQYKMDEPAKLQQMLQYCENWLNRLQG